MQEVWRLRGARAGTQEASGPAAGRDAGLVAPCLQPGSASALPHHIFKILGGVKYMAMDDDLTLGDGYTMQYTDHVS